MPRIYLFSVIVLSFSCCSFAPAQTVDDTCEAHSGRKATITRYVDQTVMETQKRTSWKPVWQTEKRERRTMVLKPVTKKYDKVDRYTVLKPVTETKYRERKIQETVYEEATEMREERRVVRKPVVETEMREEAIPVRTKVTETMIRTENVTQLKPKTVTETHWVPGVAATGVNYFRPQLQWLRRGAYTDPQTGLTTWRRPGLHWVQPPAAIQVPTLVPTAVQTTALTPEVVQKSEPVEVTRYVDKVELRKVPIQVTKMVEQVEVRKVPVIVRRPKTITRVEQIPYQETTYKEHIVTQTTPVTETTYQQVEQIEPYDEETCRWVQYTEEIKVPKTIRKRVDETIDRSPSKSAAPSVLESNSKLQETKRTATPSYNFNAKPIAAQLLETNQRIQKDTPNITDVASGQQRIDYSDSPVVRRHQSLYHLDDIRSIEFPETKPDVNNSRTKLARIEQPERQSDSSQKSKSPIDDNKPTVDWEVPAAEKPDLSKGYIKLEN